MKLEVGMYVRTKWGIAKYLHNLVTKATVYRVIDKKIIYDNVEDWEDCLLDNEIIKASHNIIDLIEVGDYVNGYIVLDIIKDNLGKTYIECGCKDEIAHNYIYDTFYNEDIKSIVTKEQFSSMEYRLGE